MKRGVEVFSLCRENLSNFRTEDSSHVIEYGPIGSAFETVEHEDEADPMRPVIEPSTSEVDIIERRF